MTGTKIKKPTKENQLENQVKDLTEKLNLLMSGASLTSNKNTEIGANDRVKVICYLLGKNGFILNKKTIMFAKSGATHTLGLAEVNDLEANDKYKSQLEAGLIVFDDDKWYTHFGIIKPIPLNDNNFKDILLGDTINKFNELSQFKKDEIVLHELMYRTAQLVKTHKVSLNFEKIDALEKYFQVKFSNLVALVDEII